MPDLAIHDTYIVWNWVLNSILVLVVAVLLLGAAQTGLGSCWHFSAIAR
jgi:hypothetical protein